MIAPIRRWEARTMFRKVTFLAGNCNISEMRLTERSLGIAVVLLTLSLHTVPCTLQSPLLSSASQGEGCRSTEGNAQWGQSPRMCSACHEHDLPAVSTEVMRWMHLRLRGGGPKKVPKSNKQTQAKAKKYVEDKVISPACMNSKTMTNILLMWKTR